MKGEYVFFFILWQMFAFVATEELRPSPQTEPSRQRALDPLIPYSPAWPMTLLLNGILTDLEIPWGPASRLQTPFFFPNGLLLPLRSKRFAGKK